MKNDKKIKETIITISQECDDFLSAPNPCAWTDSIVKNIIKLAETLDNLQKEMFNNK